MLESSEQFKEIMKSTVRPKCEPVITIEDAFGYGRDLVWKAKNLKSIKFKRGIDPLGRTLPFIELRWVEIYNGKLNENSFPQMYENISSLLSVKFEINQSLGFFNSWKNIYQKGETWSNLYKKTWKQIRNNPTSENFTFPTLFLSGKPTVKNNEIEWVAYDLLHYLDSSFIYLFLKNTAIVDQIPRVLLYDSLYPFKREPKIVESIIKSIKNLPTGFYSPLNGNLYGGIENNLQIEEKCNSFLKDYYALHSRYIDFSKDRIKVNKIFDDFQRTDFSFGINTQYTNPKITKNQNVSSYKFEKYEFSDDLNSIYEKEWDEFQFVGGEQSRTLALRYSMDGIGRIYSEGYEKGEYVFFRQSHNEAMWVKGIRNVEDPKKTDYKLKIVPIVEKRYDFTLNIGNDGIPFEENNKLNIFDSSFENIEKRKENISKYFNSRCDSIQIECLPNIALETGDIISIETNLYDDSGNRLKKDAVIVEMELNFSGSFRQIIKAHEVKIIE